MPSGSLASMVTVSGHAPVVLIDVTSDFIPAISMVTNLAVLPVPPFCASTSPQAKHTETPTATRVLADIPLHLLAEVDARKMCGVLQRPRGYRDLAPSIFLQQ